MRKYTDDQFLLNCFDIIIHKQNNLQAQLTGDLSYLFCDGFEEKIDEGMLSPFLLDLADRCGYVLVDGMWGDKKAIEDAIRSITVEARPLTPEEKKILSDHLFDLL